MGGTVYDYLSDYDGLEDLLEDSPDEVGSIFSSIGKAVKAVGKVALPIVKMVPGVGNAVSAGEMGLNVAKGAVKLAKGKKGAAPAAKPASMAATPAVVQAAVAASKKTKAAVNDKPVVVKKPSSQVKTTAPTPPREAAIVVKAAPLDVNRIVAAFSASVSPQLNQIGASVNRMIVQQKASAEHAQRTKDIKFKKDLMGRLAAIQSNA